MSDPSLNYYVSRGTTTQRLAFTPTPATPAAGPSPGYLWWDTTLQEEFAYDFLSAAWVSTSGPAAGTVTHTGTLTSGQLIKGNGGADVTVGDLSGDVTTSGGTATTIANNAVTTAKINNAAVTYAKIQNVSANSVLLGASATGSGAPPSEIALGSGLTMTGSTLSASGGSGTVTHTGALTSGQLVLGNGSADIAVGDLSGDVTTSGSAATTIAASAVTNAKLANMAQSTIKGRAAGAGTGAPVDLTATQATAILNALVGDSGSGGTAGLAPAPAAGDAAANKFLKADATWAVPAGAGNVNTTGSPASGNLTKFSGATTITNGDLSGDVTTSGTLAATIAANAVTTSKITNSAVTLAKIANAGANSVIVGAGSGGSGSAYTELTVGAGLTMGASSLTTSTAQQTRAIVFSIDGGGSALTTGIKADISVPYACTIASVVMLADQSGSVVVDIWKDTLANYPPTSGDSIVASAPPTISSATNSSDTTLTGWTTSISAGDTLRFNINSASTITRLSLTLKVTVS